MNKRYYALTDGFTGDDPAEHTAGFANTKEPISFRSARERDEWVKTTRLTTAKALSARSATSLSRQNGDKGYIREYGQDRVEFAVMVANSHPL